MLMNTKCLSSTLLHLVHFLQQGKHHHCKLSYVRGRNLQRVNLQVSQSTQQKESMKIQLCKQRNERAKKQNGEVRMEKWRALQ